MAEVWKPVKGWKGYYEVSNRGRVKSLTRVIMRENGKQQTIRERILKPHVNSHGYGQVNLSRPDKREQAHIHVLVAKAFLPPQPEGTDRVCHKDDDGANNAPSNLYWGTASSNGKDAHRNGRHADKVMPKGQQVYNATPIPTINKIRRLHLKGFKYHEITERTGAKRDTIMWAVKNKGYFAEIPWPK